MREAATGRLQPLGMARSATLCRNVLGESALDAVDPTSKVLEKRGLHVCRMPHDL